MKGLRYLFFTTLKNSVKELVKHPAKLVMVLFFVLLIGMMVVSSLCLLYTSPGISAATSLRTP